MEELLQWMEYIEDVRQQNKVRHTLKDILVIVLFATLTNANDWVEMALFADNYQDYLRKYVELRNGLPSHDTLRRVMGMASPEILQQLYGKWQELLNRNEGELLKKLSILMEKPCVPISGMGKSHPISLLHGAGRTASVWDRMPWRKKAMKLRQFRNCRIKYSSEASSSPLTLWEPKRQSQRKSKEKEQIMCWH